MIFSTWCFFKKNITPTTYIDRSVTCITNRTSCFNYCIVILPFVPSSVIILFLCIITSSHPLLFALFILITFPSNDVDLISHLCHLRSSHNITFKDFDLKKDSILKNYKIDKSLNQNLKYSFNNIDQEKNSISETFIFSAGSNYFKNEINCNLAGEYSSAFINGIFSLKNNQQHEIRSTINHLVENTKSYQLIKSVLGKNSKAAYQGRIYVDSKAQKTDGYQLSKAILLDETSEFNAKPELEIYADDVKCSHGSASGSLNEDSIFYLMSRGLNYKQSKELLINGFMLDVVEKITDLEIKNLIKNMIGLKEWI